jgi:hypothetical protein
MRKNAKISPSQHLGDQTYLEEHIKEIDESVKLGKTVSKWTIAIKYPVSQSKLTPKVSFNIVRFILQNLTKLSTIKPLLTLASICTCEISCEVENDNHVTSLCFFVITIFGILDK